MLLGNFGNPFCMGLLSLFLLLLLSSNLHHIGTVLLRIISKINKPYLLSVMETLNIIFLQKVTLVRIVSVHLLHMSENVNSYHALLKIHPELIASSLSSMRTVSTRHFGVWAEI